VPRSLIPLNAMGITRGIMLPQGDPDAHRTRDRAREAGASHMNPLHHWICRSGLWRKHLKTGLLPWALGDLDLGVDVLEIGPGYGLTTDVLRARVSRLTCVEVDRAMALSLSRRTAGANVTVVHADAVHMPLRNASFSAAICFTMLHHVPSFRLQDELLAEVARVLRPGGVFAGTDSLYSGLFGLIHFGDTMTVVDPAAFPQRLHAAGFTEIQVETGRRSFRFRARRRE
jgi:SAM-dependent methyltransferase